jgi:7-cyano-7-deazaguanine synthase in queuosine biosynthesis
LPCMREDSRLTPGKAGPTVVPGRNAVFPAIPAARAESAEGDGSYVALGVHGGDHAVYPDCRETVPAPAILRNRRPGFAGGRSGEYGG